MLVFIKQNWPSSVSSRVLVLLVLTHLILFLVFTCTTLGPEKSWVSLSSSPIKEQNKPLDVVGVPQAPSPSSSSIFNFSDHQKLLADLQTSSRGFSLNKELQKPFDGSGEAGGSSPAPEVSPENEGETRKVDVSGNETSVSAKTEVIKIYSRLERLEGNLAKVRSAIKEAGRNGSMISSHKDSDYIPQGPMYWNANSFHRSYLEMEKQFKVYVYKEGEFPIFHNGPCRSIYSTEGRFIHEMEKGDLYKTENPDEAHVYFLPFSVVEMVKFLYVASPDDGRKIIGRTVIDYINLISQRYPFWNRSLGADHFMLSCHDWGPYTTSFVPRLFKNSIRVLCNANTSEGFNPIKDASMPEIHLKTGEVTGLLGGPSPSKRPLLAFFAGRLHGHIRYLLLEEWKEKDADVQVYESLPPGVSYIGMLRKSKFCLCPSGFEVASPRVVEAIYAECVPVLISDGYIPPFSDVLNWKSFSVIVPVKDIPNIKKILMGITGSQYLRLHRRVKQVQRHFVVNGPPKRFDFFHMTVHSIWLRRLNVRVQDS